MVRISLRGGEITVTHDSIRQWCRKFGPEYARELKCCQGRLGDVWPSDGVFVKIRVSGTISGGPWTRTGT